MSRPKSRAKSRPNEARVSVAVPPRTLWGSLAAGAVIWSLHLIVSYALVSLACAGMARSGGGGAAGPVEMASENSRLGWPWLAGSSSPPMGMGRARSQGWQR